ncbi:hypothetical protein ACFX14_035607 [Malus domestica]
MPFGPALGGLFNLSGDLPPSGVFISPFLLPPSKSSSPSAKDFLPIALALHPRLAPPCAPLYSPPATRSESLCMTMSLFRMTAPVLIF